MTFRIRDSLLEVSIYLYRDEVAASAGESSGGCGFLYGHDLAPHLGTGHTLWAVTNKHVIEGNNWTIRLNLKDGGTTCIDTDDREWIYHPKTDLAVRPLALSQDVHKFSYLASEWLLTEDWENALEIGPGDPCFTIGRFIGHDGKQKNTPTTRFGQIAQVDAKPIEQGGQAIDSYLVEIRSIGGFSGSPVFVYLNSAYYRPWATGSKTGPDGSILGVGHYPTGPWLLGVTWCSVPTWEPVCDASGAELTSGYKVQANSGIMGVVPARYLKGMFEPGGAAFGKLQEIERGLA